MSAARLGSRREAAVSVAVPLALIGLAALLGGSGPASREGTVTLVLCNVVIVVGLQVLIGNSGVYSFGQLGFAAVGAYVGALLTLPAAFAALQTPELPAPIADSGLGPLPATLVAAAAAGLLAALVGLPLMRTATAAIPISSFAFLVVAHNVLANWEDVTGGSGGLVSIPRTTGIGAAALWAGVAVVAALAYKRSASGRRLAASRENEVAARSIGIRVMRERLAAFALSGLLCGAGGALAAHQSGVLSPTSFYFAATVSAVAMLVVGGTRSVLGAVVGALALAAVGEGLRGLEEGGTLAGLVSFGEAPGLATIGLGLILLATMIARPEGLTGGREAAELPWLRRALGGRRRTETVTGGGHRRVAVRAAGRVGGANGRVGGALEAEGIRLAFGGLAVLRGVDLRLERGEALGLIGPNGAGKTTLVNVLSGFQRPEEGEVALDGRRVTGRSPAQLARRGLARTFQSALPFAQLSCLESVAVGAMGVGLSRRRAAREAAWVLERLGLLELAERRSGSLTPSEQRLLGIARALATRPSYLLADEPAAGMNEEECRALVETLRGVRADFGCGLLLIEHEMSVVMDSCARVQVLDEGATVAIGSPRAVQADPAVVESYLGSSFAAVADA